MAMIPDTFVPSVTTQPIGASPMSAQPVQPMQNRAPEQEMQSGQVVQKLGEEVNNIGERIQYQLDDTMTKQAETKFFNDAQTIANGNGKDVTGYLHTIGQDAVTALPDAQAALAKAKQDGLDGLANNFQKSMYNRVASQHLATFGAQFADHHFQQQTQWAGQNAVARSNVYGSYAGNAYQSYGSVDGAGNPTGDFADYLKVAEDEALNAAHIIHGAPLGTVENPGSPMAVQALQNVHTLIGASMITNMMNLPADQRPSYEKVQQIYDDMVSKKWFDAEGLSRAGQMVRNYTNNEITRVTNAAALADAQRKHDGQPTTSTGTPDYLPMPVKGAGVTSSGYDQDRGDVIISVPPGSAIQAPASGKVIEAGTDPDGNYGVKIQHPDGSITSFDGLQTANVKIGDKVLRGDSIATTGVPLGSNKPGITWALSDKNGVNVDPTKAGLPPVDQSKITDEGVLQDGLDTMRKEIPDPRLQAEAASEMEAQVRNNQRMEREGKVQVYQSASDAFYQNANKTGALDYHSIPTATFNQLTPEQQYNFKHAGEQGKAAGDTPQNIEARYWFATHPFFTQDDVNKLSPNLTPTQAIEYAGAAAKREASGEDKNVPIDHYEFNNSMINAGMQAAVNTEGQKDPVQKMANQALYVQRHDEVQQILNDAAAAAKRPLNQTEKNKLTDDYLSKNAVMLHKPGTFTRNSSNADDKLVQFGAIKAADIPKAYVTVGTDAAHQEQIWLKDIPPGPAEDIRKYLISTGKSPTWQNIAWWWVAHRNQQIQNQQQQPGNK